SATQSYVSTTALNNNQMTTGINLDEASRQLENAYNLPRGTLRVTGIVVNNVGTNAAGRRRRRQGLYRKKPGVCSLNWNTVGTTVAGSSAGTAAVPTALDSQLGLLQGPRDLALDSSGNIYIADTLDNRVVKWASGATTGTLVTGNANGVNGAPAPALDTPSGVFVDANGNVYVTDTVNNRVRFVPAQGVASDITLPAGSSPWGITRDSSTNTLYVTGSGNGKLYQITQNGATSDVALNLLANPNGVALDSTKNRLVIANQAPANLISWTIGAAAGTAAAIAGLNPAPGASSGVTFDSSGNMYVADTANNRILFFPAGQTTGRIIAGGVNPVAPATASTLNGPFSVKLDSQGNLYVADTGANRIQKFSCILA
ncbi:unnamed protein product, partial [Rotaria sp. Silwood2]